jgi:hypothetical protein
VRSDLCPDWSQLKARSVLMTFARHACLAHQDLQLFDSSAVRVTMYFFHIPHFVPFLLNTSHSQLQDPPTLGSWRDTRVADPGGCGIGGSCGTLVLNRFGWPECGVERGLE